MEIYFYAPVYNSVIFPRIHGICTHKLLTILRILHTVTLWIQLGSVECNDLLIDTYISRIVL